MDKYEIVFKKALDLLDDAEYNFNGDRYNTSINRSYYAVFYAAKSLLLKKGVDTRKHTGNIQMFGKEYVVNDNFDKEISRILSELQEDRSRVDYDFEFNSTKAIAKLDLENAKKFIEECKKFLWE